MTLIGTLTTTSGTGQTQALGGTYREILCVFNGVSTNSSAGTVRIAVSDDGSIFDSVITLGTQSSAAEAFSGFVYIYNTGVAATTKHVVSFLTSSSGVPTATTGTQASENGITNSVRVSATHTFDAGSVVIYGRA